MTNIRHHDGSNGSLPAKHVGDPVEIRASGWGCPTGWSSVFRLLPSEHMLKHELQHAAATKRIARRSKWTKSQPNASPHPPVCKTDPGNQSRKPPDPSRAGPAGEGHSNETRRRLIRPSRTSASPRFRADCESTSSPGLPSVRGASSEVSSRPRAAVCCPFLS